MHYRRAQYRRQENIFQLTHRLTETQTRRKMRYAPWIAAAAFLFAGFAVINSYWQSTTGHPVLACYADSSPSCASPSLKIHGE